MVYYINYTYWVIFVSFLIVFIFMINFRTKKVKTIFLGLGFLLVFAPRILPLDYLTVLGVEESTHTLDEIGDTGKELNNMISFEDKNYSIYSELEEKNLESGFYDNIRVVQIRKLFESSVFKLKFQIKTYYKYAYIDEREE